MITYALRRLGAGIVLALLVTLITFFLLSGSLESVARERLGSAATPESIKGLMTQLGFDRPAIVQYLDWLGSVLTGDFGTSLFTSQPVAPAALPWAFISLLDSVVSIRIGVTA